MVILISEVRPQEVAVGVDAAPAVLAIVDALNSMNVVLMEAIVVEEEEEVTKVESAVVEEIITKGIGKKVFIILDLVILTWKRNYLALLKTPKQHTRVLISTSMIISQLKLLVEMSQLLLKRYMCKYSANDQAYLQLLSLLLLQLTLIC
jgi:hypothetical protein